MENLSLSPTRGVLSGIGLTGVRYMAAIGDILNSCYLCLDDNVGFCLGKAGRNSAVSEPLLSQNTDVDRAQPAVYSRTVRMMCSTEKNKK